MSFAVLSSLTAIQFIYGVFFTAMFRREGEGDIHNSARVGVNPEYG
jgi:hypothetical protein